MRARFPTMAALFVVAASCLAAGSGAQRAMRTHDEFVADLSKFPYAADSAREQKIRVGVQALQYCMNTAQVVEFLGDPDFMYIAKGTKQMPETAVLTYVLAQQSEQERPEDQRIIIWMARPDDLRGVSVWGIRELKGLEGSAHMKCH